MNAEPNTIQELAAEATSWFETAKRPDATRDDYFVRVKDGAPAWVGELVHAAHGGLFLPDDWRYQAIRNALEWIAEADEPEDGAGEFAESAVDVYNDELIVWLGSNLNRIGYCDEAASEFGYDDDSDRGVMGMISMGQYVEASEVYSLVLYALQGVAASVER